jgi:hypothetical protein
MCPKTPQDVLATLYRHLGIDATTSSLDHISRLHAVLLSDTLITKLS